MLAVVWGTIFVIVPYTMLVPPMLFLRVKTTNRFIIIIMPSSEFTVQKKIYSEEKSLQCRKKFAVQKKVYSAELLMLAWSATESFPLNGKICNNYYVPIILLNSCTVNFFLRHKLFFCTDFFPALQTFFCTWKLFPHCKLFSALQTFSRTANFFSAL